MATVTAAMLAHAPLDTKSHKEISEIISDIESLSRFSFDRWKKYHKDRHYTEPDKGLYIPPDGCIYI